MKSSYEQQFQTFGVDPSTAALAGNIAQKQATDPTYTLTNTDQNIINAAFGQMLRHQFEQALRQQQEEQERRRRDEEAQINKAVWEYVRLLEQAQETESVGLVDAAATVKQQLLAAGGVSEIEFNRRVHQIDGALWSAPSDDNEEDDSLFEARWRQVTQGVGVPGSDQMQEVDDPFRALREQQIESPKQRQSASPKHAQQPDFDL